MTGDPGAVPPQRPSLIVVRPGTGTRRSTGPEVPPPAPVPEDGTAVPAAVSTVAPITMPERVGTAIAGTVRELWLHPDRLGHALWHGAPSTMAGHRDYVKSRAWVPAEMTGKSQRFLIAAGVAYHLVIARPLKAAAKTVDAAADRPLRLLGLAIFVIVLFVLLSAYL